MDKGHTLDSCKKDPEFFWTSNDRHTCAIQFVIDEDSLNLIELLSLVFNPAQDIIAHPGTRIETEGGCRYPAFPRTVDLVYSH